MTLHEEAVEGDKGCNCADAGWRLGVSATNVAGAPKATMHQTLLRSLRKDGPIGRAALTNEPMMPEGLPNLDHA
jgi:hypothetical protein